MSEARILLAHGSGGQLSQKLISEVFQPAWNNPIHSAMLDGAILDLPAGKIAMTTDSFVITPVFFPGGDIGKLSICGTVNDLVACGARPLYMTTAFIIEEGFALSDLKTIVASMAATAKAAGVHLVAGDTKVVEKGSADKIYINTTGIGVITANPVYSPQRIEAGDVVIVSGNIGDHGLAILAQREGLQFQTPTTSDCASLHEIGRIAENYGSSIRVMRDPTRGGLATVINELALQSGLSITLKEKLIPISPAVRGATAMLGVDPLYMANEGKMVIIVAAEAAADLLIALKRTNPSQDAAIIGNVKPEPKGMVLLETDLGSARILPMLEGEHLPRIC